MRRTKIVATVGPATSSADAVSEIIKAGADVIRLNFSHGTREGHGRVIRMVRKAAADLGKHVAVMQDLQGPRLRTASVAGGGTVNLSRGEKWIIDTRGGKTRQGRIGVTYRRLARDVTPGDRILLDDGRVELAVTSSSGTQIACQVVYGGELGSNRGVNLPGIAIRSPALTGKDKADLEFGLRRGVDYVALSFVSSAKCLAETRNFMRRCRREVPLVAKIERRQAVQNLGEILAVSDVLMVARGDLALETSPEEVPLYQKLIISEARKAGKLVITATQMLESMVHSPSPTRAEASDVANAVLDGSDALMLSGETAIGRYPVRAVKTMAAIAARTDDHDRSEGPRPEVELLGRGGYAEAAVQSACLAAHDLRAAAIIAFTRSGRTAVMVCKRRPTSRIFGMTFNDYACKRLALAWGVTPVKVPFKRTTAELLTLGESELLKRKLIKVGDVIVMLVGSTPVGGVANMMKIDIAGKGDLSLRQS